MKITAEYSIRLYDDESGDYLSLRPNLEGAGLYEISSVVRGQTEGSLVLTDEQLDALVEGLKKLRELNVPKFTINFPISVQDVTTGPIIWPPDEEITG